MEAAAGQDWFLRKHEEGSIFGPLPFAQRSGYRRVRLQKRRRRALQLLVFEFQSAVAFLGFLQDTAFFE